MKSMHKAVAHEVPASQCLNELALRHLEVNSREILFLKKNLCNFSAISRRAIADALPGFSNFKLCIKANNVTRLEYIVIGVGALTSRINLTAHDRWPCPHIRSSFHQVADVNNFPQFLYGHLANQLLVAALLSPMS